MANNPLDTNAFTHYLRFISLGKEELYQIAEPIGFDTANFVKQQEAKRYARSIEYGSIEKLTFVDVCIHVFSCVSVVSDSVTFAFILILILFQYASFSFPSWLIRIYCGDFSLTCCLG